MKPVLFLSGLRESPAPAALRQEDLKDESRCKLGSSVCTGPRQRPT